MHPQHYRFTITFDSDNLLYGVVGFVKVGNKWSMDGAIRYFGYMDEVIRFLKDETNTTRNVM